MRYGTRKTVVQTTTRYEEDTRGLLANLACSCGGIPFGGLGGRGGLRQGLRARKHALMVHRLPHVMALLEEELALRAGGFAEPQVWGRTSGEEHEAPRRGRSEQEHRQDLAITTTYYY